MKIMKDISKCPTILDGEKMFPLGLGRFNMTSTFSGKLSSPNDGLQEFFCRKG
jgi:hypothetical protein